MTFVIHVIRVCHVSSTRVLQLARPFWRLFAKYLNCHLWSRFKVVLCFNLRCERPELFKKLKKWIEKINSLLGNILSSTEMQVCAIAQYDFQWKLFKVFAFKTFVILKLKYGSKQRKSRQFLIEKEIFTTAEFSEIFC